MAVTSPRPASAACEPANATCVLCGSADRRTLFTKQGHGFVRCTCGLVSLDPLPNEAALAAHHEASYREGRYATFAAADDVRVAIARQRLALLRPLAPQGPWLDVGCSTGTFVAEAVAAGLPAEGVEVSSAAVAQAQARGLRVNCAPVERFAPTAPCAMITAFDLIEHVPDPRRVLESVRAWLRRDGILALTLPDIASPTARLLGRQWFYYAAPDHVHYFSPPTITRLLVDAGFHVEHVRPATKAMTIGYAADQLRHMAPALAPFAWLADHVVPRAWRARPIPLPLGEMLVIARPSAP